METIYSGNQARFSTCMPKICGKSNNSFPSEIEVELQLYYHHINCLNYSDIWLQYLETLSCIVGLGFWGALFDCLAVALWNRTQQFWKQTTSVESIEFTICLQWCWIGISSFSSALLALLENRVFPGKISKQMLWGWACPELCEPCQLPGSAWSPIWLKGAPC